MGIIEYIDVNESDNSIIALTNEDLCKFNLYLNIQKNLNINIFTFEYLHNKLLKIKLMYIIKAK